MPDGPAPCGRPKSPERETCGREECVRMMKVQQTSDKRRETIVARRMEQGEQGEGKSQSVNGRAEVVRINRGRGKGRKVS